jgi:hypothetical protein
MTSTASSGDKCRKTSISHPSFHLPPFFLLSSTFSPSAAQVEIRALEIDPDLFAAWAEKNAAEENAARREAA